MLARLFLDEAKRESMSPVRSAIEAFGQESGLFKRIAVRRYGGRRSVASPFRLLVDMWGARIDLVDVGYGVSQSLPLLVDSLVRPDVELLLIQQPEVHLHPRAQAALGSFFATLVSTRFKRFVIETHSDHLVDRVRLEISKGTLDPSLVSLIYLEREGLETVPYHITFDTLGNVIGAPPGYRSFFLREQLELLGQQPDD